MKFYLLLALISLLDVGAVIGSRYYVEKKKPWILAAALLGFAASAYVYVQMMAFRGTAIVNVLAAAFSTLAATFVFYALFKERITKGQWVGILVAFVGILMLEVGA